MKEKEVSGLAPYFPMLCQGAVFCSMFFALRGMANAPVESMKVGGLSWFTDLTIADPYFLLPVITAGSVFVHIKMGADGVDAKSMPPAIRKLLLAMPLISLPVMCQFPAVNFILVINSINYCYSYFQALNVYWLSTNLISIVQTRIIRQPTFRKQIGLGQMKVWDDKDLPMNSALFGGLGRSPDPR